MPKTSVFKRKCLSKWSPNGIVFAKNRFPDLIENDFCVFLVIFEILGYESPPSRLPDLIVHDFGAIFCDFS